MRYRPGVLWLMMAAVISGGCGPKPKPVPPEPPPVPPYKELVAVPFLPTGGEMGELVKLALEIQSKWRTAEKGEVKVVACAGVHRVAFTPDGTTLIAGGVDKVSVAGGYWEDDVTRTGVKFWTLPAGKPTATLVQDTEHHMSGTGAYIAEVQVKGLLVDPDGKRLWVSNAGRKHDKKWGSKVWSLPEGKVLAENVAGRDPRYHPNGKWIVAGLSVIDAETARKVEMPMYRDGKTPTTDFRFIDSLGGSDISRDGSWLARVGETTLWVEPLKPGEPSFTMPVPAKDEWRLPEQLFFTADGRRLVGLCQREYGKLEKTKPSRVRAWSMADRKLLWETEVPSHANFLAVSPDGHWAALACGDGMVRLLSTATGEEKLALTGHTSAVMTVGFSQDGKLIASGDTDTVRVWKAGE